MMKKITGAFGALTLLLAACGAASAPPAATQAPVAPKPAATAQPAATVAAPAATAAAPAPTVVVPPGAVKITFWYALAGAQGKVVEAMVDKYNKSQSAVAVEVIFQGSYADIAQKLTAGIAAKSVPDVAQMGGAPTMGDSGAVINMADLVSAADKADIFDGFWEYNKYKGQIVSMPFNNSVPLLYYNVDLFKAAGLDPAKPPTTWDELVTAAKALTKDTNGDGKPDQWGFNTHTDTHWYFSAMLMQNGGKVLSDDGKKVVYNGPEALEALQFWGDLVNKHKVMPANQHAQAAPDFLAGKLGMIMRSSSTLTTLERDAKFKLGVTGLPCKKVCSVPIGGASLLVFKTTAEKQKAAADFVKWMTSPANSVDLFLQTGYVPIRKSVSNEPALKDYMAKSPNAEMLVKQLQYASAIPLFSELGNSDEQLRKAIEKIELGVGTAQEALNTAADVINKALAVP